jgi:DNA-binding XRE family transcriptional regulator
LRDEGHEVHEEIQLTIKIARSFQSEISETFARSLEITFADMIRATHWHEVSVIPAKAGIHPLPPLDAGLRRHDELRKKPWAGEMVAISCSVDERKLMNTSW